MFKLAKKINKLIKNGDFPAVIVWDGGWKESQLTAPSIRPGYSVTIRRMKFWPFRYKALYWKGAVLKYSWNESRLAIAILNALEYLKVLD